MKLTKQSLQALIKEELILLEANSGISPKTGRPWTLNSMTGKKHWGAMPADDEPPGSSQTDDGSVPVEIDQEVNEDSDAYWVMVDDLVTSIGRQRATRVEGSDDEVYIRTGHAEGITVKVVRRGR